MFEFALTLGNKYKSLGAKSGEYGECGIEAMSRVFMNDSVVTFLGIEHLSTRTTKGFPCRFLPCRKKAWCNG
jgi:hypothetical protein